MESLAVKPITRNINGINITEDHTINDSRYGITKKIREEIDIAATWLDKKNKNKAIKDLNHLSIKYPSIPQIRNLLAVANYKAGNISKCREINQALVRDHPDDLFGRIGLAEDFIRNGKFEKVPEVLIESMDLKDLVPERSLFHENEVFAFYSAAYDYFLETDQEDGAIFSLNILQEMDPDNAVVLNHGLNLVRYRLKKGLERYEDEMARARTVKVIAKKVCEETREPPVFHHPEIMELYQNDLSITQDTILQLLALPGTTLIADLENVVLDSIARYKYFSSLDWNDQTHYFLQHALFLLTELKAEESLQTVLHLLRQDDEFTNYWFADHMTDCIWECLYMLGQNSLPELKDYLFEPNHSSYSRSIVSFAVSQIAMHEPQRRQEVIQWFDEAFDHFLKNQTDDTIIDSELIGLMIGDVLDIEGRELREQLKKLHEAGLVTESISGDWQEVSKELDRPFVRSKEMELYGIFDKYNHFLSWLHGEPESEDINPFFNDLPEIAQTDHYREEHDYEDAPFEVIASAQPYVRADPKIGRNDACPCGSGKKYKKCCGK
ncbi:MAG: DUF1186 domain-containing protein [Chitinophagales bacterium]